MKTWICIIYGGGAPAYIISAENEKRAWELISDEVSKEYHKEFSSYSLKKNTSGLIEINHWKCCEERIDDFHELYSVNGIIVRGSYEGLE